MFQIGHICFYKRYNLGALSGIGIEVRLFLQFFLHAVVFIELEPEFRVLFLRLIFFLFFFHLGQLFQIFHGFRYLLTLSVNPRANSGKLISYEFLNQILLKTFAGAGKILLTEINRFVQNGFADRNTRLKNIVYVNIRLFPKYAADFIPLTSSINRFNRHLAAAAERVRYKAIFILLVKGLLPKGNIKYVAHGFQNRGFPAAANADEGVQLG